MAIRHLHPDLVTRVTEVMRPPGRKALVEKIRELRNFLIETYEPDDIAERPSKVRTVVNLKELADDIESFVRPARFVFGDTVYNTENKKAVIIMVLEEAEQLQVVYEGESVGKLQPISDFRKTL
jgi:hypothetical protein